jgi:hypothetical protein
VALSTVKNGPLAGTITSFGASESEPEEEEAQASHIGNADASQEQHQTTLQEMPNETSSEQTVPNTTNNYDADASRDLHQATTLTEQPVPNATNEHETQATCRDVPSPMALIPRNKVQDQMREWLMEETIIHASSLCKHFPGYTFKTLRSIWYHTKTELHKQGHDRVAILKG